MSRTFERSALSTQTPAKIDYSQFYRNLGDLVIEGACSGNPICETIYKRAWHKTTANLNESNAETALQTAPAEDVEVSGDSRGATLSHGNKERPKI